MVVITIGSTASTGLFHLAATVLLDHLPCWNPGGGSGFQLRSCWEPDKSCGLHCRLWRDGSDYIPAGSVGPAAGSLWITLSLFYWLFFACFSLGGVADLLQQFRVEAKPFGSGKWSSLFVVDAMQEAKRLWNSVVALSEKTRCQLTNYGWSCGPFWWCGGCYMN